jgi:hypothetical protein
VIDFPTPALPPPESVTWTVNEKGPAMDGVPETELDDRVSPTGSEPALIDQLYGGRPPDTPSATTGYAIPTSPDGKVTLVMLNAGGPTVVGGVGAVAGGVETVVPAVGLVVDALSAIGEALISALGLGPTRLKVRPHPLRTSTSPQMRAADVVARSTPS